MNDVLQVSSNQEISGDVNNSCFCRPGAKSLENSVDIECTSKLAQSDEKKSMSLSAIVDNIKVINSIFLSVILMLK